MCDCDNIEVVGIKRGDTLVFFVDTDYYDLEDISEVMESVKEAFPTTKVLMLPDDMIADIKIFREEDPLIEVEMKVANNGINKNLTQIDWAEQAFLNADYGLTEIHP
jgi:short-subunit dehydrogenase involved in D-alanine esterification of teichoic acids